jgi:S-DNA-T family DNA segregation ATPase FtsK/SpoIIIE
MQGGGRQNEPPCRFPEASGQAVSSGPRGLHQYPRARQLILELGVASPSGLQRQLSIERHEAVRHIERMQEEGLVSLPNDMGRREILAVRPEQAEPARP